MHYRWIVYGTEHKTNGKPEDGEVATCDSLVSSISIRPRLGGYANWGVGLSFEPKRGGAVNVASRGTVANTTGEGGGTDPMLETLKTVEGSQAV